MSEVQGGILTGNAIREAVEMNELVVDPFDVKLLNPASIDLRLGATFGLYGGVDPDLPRKDRPRIVLDAAAQCSFATHSIPGDGLVLEPGTLYLMHTFERVGSRKYVSCLDGKSSIGRLGVVVHLTAGYVDPGFFGQLTLEVTAVHPTRVYAGMRFCQLRVHSLVGAVSDYAEKGNYIGDGAVGPVASRSWKQFQNG